jgi:protein gp37
MKVTKIQWCHSTINPVAGCLGCELFPTPEQLFRLLERAFSELGLKIDSRKWFKKLIASYYSKIKNPGPGHLNEITTTNVWHLRKIFADQIARKFGKEAGNVAFETIKERMKCYAAILHLNRASNIASPDRGLNSGYAPTFEQFTMFEGRMLEASKWSDLVGTTDPNRPWLDCLPRLIFLSDMGDALCSKTLFPFLQQEMAHITSEYGHRHLWLWLTKRPQNMRAFADRIGGFPPNICAMSTVTSTKTLHRVDKLRQVNAACRGLSIEPLWERIPPELLNLDGIDWVIVGGESGNANLTAPFHLEWAEELMAHCRRNGVAFFMKQVGRNPFWKGKPFPVADSHGGEWDEWPAKLRVRQFPAYFRSYRGKITPALSPS